MPDDSVKYIKLFIVTWGFHKGIRKFMARSVGFSDIDRRIRYKFNALLIKYLNVFFRRNILVGFDNYFPLKTFGLFLSKCLRRRSKHKHINIFRQYFLLYRIAGKLSHTITPESARQLLQRTICSLIHPSNQFLKNGHGKFSPFRINLTGFINNSAKLNGGYIRIIVYHHTRHLSGHTTKAKESDIDLRRFLSPEIFFLNHRMFDQRKNRIHGANSLNFPFLLWNS